MIKLRFFTLAQNTIKINLSARNDSIPMYPLTRMVSKDNKMMDRLNRIKRMVWWDDWLSSSTTEDNIDYVTEGNLEVQPTVPEEEYLPQPEDIGVKNIQADDDPKMVDLLSDQKNNLKYEIGTNLFIFEEILKKCQQNIFSSTVIGSTIEQDSKYYIDNNVQTFIRTEEKKIRSLSTPGIVRKDEPNEVLIEIFQGELQIFEIDF